MVHQIAFYTFVVSSLLSIVLIMMQPSKQQQQGLMDVSDIGLFTEKKSRGFEKQLQIITAVIVLFWFVSSAILMFV